MRHLHRDHRGSPSIGEARHSPSSGARYQPARRTAPFAIVHPPGCWRLHRCHHQMLALIPPMPRRRRRDDLAPSSRGPRHPAVASPQSRPLPRDAVRRRLHSRSHHSSWLLTTARARAKQVRLRAPPPPRLLTAHPQARPCVERAHPQPRPHAAWQASCLAQPCRVLATGSRHRSRRALAPPGAHFRDSHHRVIPSSPRRYEAATRWKMALAFLGEAASRRMPKIAALERMREPASCAPGLWSAEDFADCGDSDRMEGSCGDDGAAAVPQGHQTFWMAIRWMRAGTTAAASCPRRS